MGKFNQKSNCRQRDVSDRYMKIGIFIKNFAVGKQFDKSGVPNKSGAEFHGENHAKLLLEYGDDVYIMTKKTYFFTKGRELINGIDVCRLHAPFRWLEIFFRLCTTHKNTDCFYIIGTPKFSVWAILFAKFKKKPTTLVLTSKVEVFTKTNNWRTKIFSSCDNYIAISNEIISGLIKKGKIPCHKVHLLPQGVDTKRRFYPVGEVRKKFLREKYKISTDGKIILFCARVVLNKGIDTMLKAWEIIHEVKPELLLLVVGGGVNDLLEEIRITSKKLDNSIMVVGEVERTDEYYQLSDIYLFPSRFEGLPTTLMEAISCGLPCIASRIGGCEDLILPSKSGILVEPESYKSFAEEVLNLVDNERMSKEYSVSGRNYALKYLDCHTLLPSLRNILKNIQIKD